MIVAATPQNSPSPAPAAPDCSQFAIGAVADRDDDALLVRRSRRGDVNAYRQLVERHERRVVSILTRILPSRQPGVDAHPLADIDDLAQEVFVLAWRALPSFRGDARFSTWLYRIATNRAIKEWRRSQRQPGRGWCDVDVDVERRGMATASDFAARDPESLVQTGLRDQQLRSAIDSLPEKQRLVILLHYYEEYSCEEIGATLGCSVGTVWSRLHYACRRLRSRMADAEKG